MSNQGNLENFVQYPKSQQSSAFYLVSTVSEFKQPILFHSSQLLSEVKKAFNNQDNIYYKQVNESQIVQLCNELMSSCAVSLNIDPFQTTKYSFEIHKCERKRMQKDNKCQTHSDQLWTQTQLLPNKDDKQMTELNETAVSQSFNQQSQNIQNSLKLNPTINLTSSITMDSPHDNENLCGSCYSNGNSELLNSSLLKSAPIWCIYCRTQCKGTFIVTNCNHIFHTICLQQLFDQQLKQNNTFLKCLCSTKVKSAPINDGSDTLIENRLFRNQLNVIYQNNSHHLKKCIHQLCDYMYWISPDDLVDAKCQICVF